MDNLQARLYRREICEVAGRFKSHRKLYSHRQLVADLDIVNELDGHSGCVNALSWSKSGNLLASGSDDQHLNIHAYQHSDSTNQFQLTATVATGHTQNIFSVKFMPHHNDRTVITAAGDGEVRIFDLEYAGKSGTTSTAATLAAEGRRRGRHTIFSGVRYLTDGDTDCRVYRSHGDRVKRIVTESSPHLFLTCSEDGEVRQWDLRQPSSAYPPPRGSHFGPDSSVPPPLISYRRYNLDLNSVTCSGSQPHYIALGGAHLHAFLHDRRMTGRDRLREAGRVLPPISEMSEEDQELMSQATQCVRKFAPDGKSRMKQGDSGHITACKISDSRPDEMIVSWSGDDIYSFDLIRDSKGECLNQAQRSLNTGRVKEGRDRKRKRNTAGSEASPSLEQRALSQSHTEQNASLRIRYQNGQTEDIPIPSRHSPETRITNAQRNAQRIARATVRIRVAMFGPQTSSGPAAQFTTAISHAADVLPDIDDVIRDWGYPMEPTEGQVYAQQTLRRQREMTRRFVQAAGTLARALGGRLTTSTGTSPVLAQFAIIDSKRNDKQILRTEQFRYDFVKAILLWLESGLGQLIEGFTRPADMPPSVKAATRLPIPESDASVEAVDDILIPYLLSYASESPVLNVESNRFERDEARQIFPSEKAAVRAFAAAVKIPFADLSSAVERDADSERIHAQDRQTAHNYWARKVARGLLLSASERVVAVRVDQAFGGVGEVPHEVAMQEAGLEQPMADSDDEVAVQSVGVVTAGHDEIVDVVNAEDLRVAAQQSRSSGAPDQFGQDENGPVAQVNETGPRSAISPVGQDDEDEDTDVNMEESEDPEDDDIPDDEDDDDDDDDDDNGSDDELSSDPDELDGVPNTGLPRFVTRNAFQRRQLRSRVEADTPCSGPTRQYTGHCNVRTVKDVNYFGPDDDYVVSGSDDGNFFIWDRKTTELVNILEGDGEIVNVVQGHPYETMLAVSGIDHTIKIFSPDARAREVARFGQSILAHDASDFSSLQWPRRAGGRRPRRAQEPRQAVRDAATTTSEPAVSETAADDLRQEDDGYVAPKGLASRKRMHDQYRIVQSNELARQDRNQDTVSALPHAHLLQLLFGQLGHAGIFPTFE